MTILHEVPGAAERPSGCTITLSQDAQGTVLITIPARGATFVMFLIAAMQIAFLLAVFVLGILVLLLHVSIPWLVGGSAGALPLPMRPFLPLLLFFWAIALALGVFGVLTAARLVYTQETLSLGQNGVRHTRRFLRSAHVRQIPREEIGGFQFQRDPQGFVASTLTLVARGEEISVAEHVREIDREWLASVCQALLRVI